MISSFYTAATGTINLQNGFDVTANNIANVSTNGYKASKPTFADLMYTNIHAPQGSDSDLKSGHGTKLQKTDTVFVEGGLNNTQRSLDYAITDPRNFFAVETNGQIKFTRDGSFHLSVENDGKYLVTSDGGYVLDGQGNRIKVNNENETQNIGVFTFGNTDGLVRDGNNYFTANDRTGLANPVPNAEIKKGYLESSSVNIADEMVSVIELQKAFQFNSKIVQVSDEIMQTVNALR